jgi:hypothetical protein
MPRRTWTEADLKFTDIRVERGPVIVDIEWIGEGNDGDFYIDDPDDEPLLRFTVSKRTSDGLIEQIDDASYSTRLPIDTDVAKLDNVAETIMNEVYDQVMAGHSIKKLCQRLSWIDADGVASVPASRFVA